MEKDKTNKVEIYIHDGGQGNFAFDNGQINATQNNLTGINNHKQSDKCNIVVDKKFQNNKKQEYIDNWNSRLFLHQDNEERPLTLADVFIMPDYCYNVEIKEKDFSNQDTLEKIIEKFIVYNRTSNMLIKGVPGIGKTSIVSWIANKYKEDERIIILRFRDWEKEELEKGLLKAIYNTLKCKKVDLNDKILILDGFDEIKSLNAREQLLHNFLNEILDIRNIKIIITSRLGYLDSVRFQNEFELLPFNNDYVKNFYQKITGKEIDKRKISDEKLNVLGIPVILYMAIMSGIDITEKATKPELYNRIFAEVGGIFDRFSYKGIAYDEGSHLFRNRENIKKYLKFLREIAFMMFEKNDLSLQKKEYQIPELEFQGDLVNILEFPIKHLFENTKYNIEFIHKSIYEYFVAEYFFIKKKKKMKEDVEREELAGVLGSLFRANILSKEILEFLKYKVKNSELNKKFDILNDAFQVMLKDGMTYYINRKCKNIIKCEINVFANMLEIIHLWGNWYLEYTNFMYVYLKSNVNHKLNLTKVDLRKANLEKISLISAELRETNLAKVNLRGANLEDADLRGANLEDADLKNANLVGADLRKINLGKVDLKEVELEETIFDESQISYLKDKYDLQETRIYIEKINKIITYEEYCSRRK